MTVSSLIHGIGTGMLLSGAIYAATDGEAIRAALFAATFALMFNDGARALWADKQQNQ